ncbi:dehydrodolichyl diphosphate synthase complex subunit DHDDS-like [Bradysia coprophila]|uniref:dehydrodolichyl diphosphate synthase complex subunit DHDDS-like n=1 Tax=Bradysia coprophila TaxID=38358 RepID=UPI00187DA3AF|nr:dehydrodolichyl diphosphate synthase complex subunit DHDDS-like [Bradysia coprophila]
MSWLCESNLNWLQRFSVRLMQCGPIPKHIAFIMDGNRRFATKNNLKSKTEGHAKGFDKLVEILQWCLDIGVKEVTAYAFSIENFKRNKEEVDTLMKMAKEKFQKLVDDENKLNERGICVRIVGNLTLLPIDLQSIMAKVMLMTRNNDRAVWNIAFAYTSRDEMTESVRTIVNGVQQLELNVDDINDNLFRSCMYMSKTPDPDLIVRTSGETRLSDFLMYQCSTSIIYCSDTLWPELGIWQLLIVIFYYQQHKLGMVKARQCLDSYADKFTTTDEHARHQMESFVNRNEIRKMQHLEGLTKVDHKRRTNVRSSGFKK